LPHAINATVAQYEYGFATIEQPELGAYGAIILAVAHQQFKAMGAVCLRALGKPEHVLFDLNHIVQAAESDLRL
jgi:UDP-N-acetyl-D-galactosamine dehydrogenase